jgi:hypothetical protein
MQRRNGLGLEADYAMRHAMQGATVLGDDDAAVTHMNLEARP